MNPSLRANVSASAAPATRGRIDGGGLRLVPLLTLGLLSLPVLAGLAGTLGAAFGLSEAPLPPTGQSTIDAVSQWPGLWRASVLSFTTGLASTLLSLIISLGLIATLAGSRLFSLMRRLLSPLLAVPHAAAALGLAFLISPSGWLARIFSPWATGWKLPPDLLILNDPWGISLTLGLVAKEVPFLLLMALAALAQTQAASRATLAASLGYGRVMGFALTTLPDLYRQLRLPLYAVLAYAMTAVEMAMILGPSLPPTLSVQITHWMMDPSLAQRGTAAAAAVLQIALVGAGLACLRLIEIACARSLPRLACNGGRGRSLDAPMTAIVAGLGGTVALSLLAGLACLALWSVAGLWTFPEALPHSISLTTWHLAGMDLADTLTDTFFIAAMATVLATALTLGCLEAEQRYQLQMGRLAKILLYLPLLVPQIAFLPGLQVLTLHLGAAGSLASVTAAHLVFVLPYVFLSLATPYRRFDPKIALIGTSLGASDSRIFWHLRLPMLLAPLLTAMAVGLAVSVGQYLPSLLIGGGRVETLTTEAVALASGGNRRIIGAYGLAQMLLPAAGFFLALVLPSVIFRNRRGLLPEGKG